MAQIIPSITSLPSDSGAAPSVEDIQDHLPSICVDYLSHNWTEEDVWASWRNMTRHKHEIANGVRLENASWRTWQKQRNKLRTISPETLNWLKDSDVTWLYGPLHTANVQSVPPPKLTSTADRLGIENGSAKPGILKHRTLSELLSIPGTSSPTAEEGEGEDGPSDYITATGKSKGNKKPALMKTKSDSLLSRSNSLPARRRAPPDLSLANDTKAKAKKETSPENTKDSGKRHITFNTFVEQCIALDDPILNREDSDEEDMLEMKTSLSRYSSRSSSGQSGSSQTIQKIPPTMLKTLGSYTNNPTLPRMVYMPPLEYRSPGVEETPVTSPMGIPSPRVAMAARQWNNNPAATQLDDDFHTGDDYFGGPDLTAGPSPAKTATSPAAAGSYGRSPVVQQPPAQPKWRAGQDSSAAASSTSSSTSSLNGLGSPSPGRGILKVRSPQPPSAEAESPDQLSPPVSFNYNPSVATGFGGLYGSYDGSPAAIPFNGQQGQSNEPEARGRSTSRGHGSSQFDRSTASRNSSSSSIGSVSRSPGDNAATPAAIPKPVARPANPALDKVQEGSEWRPAPASSTQEPMDVDYSPERSTTPTPHSSPQIVLRPLKDTSPASLPHTSTRNAASAPAPASAPASSYPLVPTAPTADLNADMQIDSASTVPMSSPTGMQSPATVASVTTFAEPTLSQPVDDEDGSTLIGRATNIANTAKDLLGALWYGAHDEQGRAAQPAGRRNHRRGGSLG